MKILIVLVSFLFIIGSIGCAVENNPQTISEYEKIFNQYREANGAKPLVFTDDLNRLAALRVKEIQNDFSHDSAGHYNKHLAENIVEGIHGNDSALDCWDGSILHKGNMLGSYVYTGYAIDHGYAVQLFSDYETIDGVPQLPPGWRWPGE